MTKKLEELLNINPAEEKPVEAAPTAPIPTHMNLQQTLEEFDKISAALPQVRGLGDISDSELDALAKKAEDAFDDIYDLGMNVEARYSTRMFEVAGNMLNAAITAKSAKIDKKLKMVELQLKKLAIDKKDNPGEGNGVVAGEGYVIADRNSLMAKLKNMDK
jgi:hypothetical protein